MTKTAIRKRLHFTDERHDLVTAIRKYGVFADGPALPFRDTGFWARNGVSLQGKTSVSQNLLAIQVFWPKMMCRGMGKLLFSQNRLAIQTFGRKKVCRGKKNSSMHENPFTTQGFEPEMVYRCMGKPLFRKTCSRYRLLDGKGCVAARKTVQCTKTRSRHRFFSRKGCVAAWKTAQ